MQKTIKECFTKKKIVRLTQQVAKDSKKYIFGYILDYSKNFLLLQESEDFRALGYYILPLEQTVHIRNNNNDKYYDKIMKKEKEKDKILLKTKLDLSSWKSIFQSLKKFNKTIIVECEDPDIDSFTIGNITKVTDKSVYILYFNASGFLDEKATRIDYKYITKVIFDDKYTEVFSKYLRKRKKKIK